ncbi:MAG: Obg family GTPase CgtA, partial [Eggerthellaceae bacterium]|nr:Obg family GTPase CgtA [Eggerthellaceae bacterium]
EHKREARDRQFRVVRLSEDVFRVVGGQVERMVVQTDWENEEAIAFFQHRFKKLGVDKALAKAGAVDGDEVRILEHSFDFDSGMGDDDAFRELEL